MHQLRYLRKQGGVRWVEVHARVTVEDDHITGATGTLRDVTDRRRIEARLMEADRMIAVGTLAVGVAHEINNPLAYVIGNLQWAEAALASSPYAAPDGPLADLRRALGDAAEGADRVRRIVRDLKALARSDDGVRQPVHLPAVIESAASICHSEIHHRARLVRELASTPAVLGNEGKIAQVLVNLLVNAAQAIPEGDPRGNSIWIRTSCEGDRVALEVADTGCGIAPEHLPRIFDPFFTTKPVGKGTGLGLAIGYGIVERHGGALSAANHPEGGAVFTLRVPIAGG